LITSLRRVLAGAASLGFDKFDMKVPQSGR
jgi:hypothetical protein